MGFRKKTIVTIDCKADPETVCGQIKRAYQELEERISHVINEEGILSANLPADIKVSTVDGDKNVSHLLKGLTSGVVDGDPSVWESLGSSEVLLEDSAYSGVAVTNDGLWYAAISGIPFSDDGRFYIHAIVDGIVATATTGTITSAKFDSPLGGSIVIHPLGNYCAIISTDSGDSGQLKLQIIDITDKSSPSILGELDLTDPGTNQEAVWDDVREVIYWPAPGGGVGLLVFDVSALTAPTLASTYTTSNLTNVQSCVLSVDRDFLYMSGSGGFESASLAADGTLTRDTTVSTGTTYSSLAHNGTTIAGALRASSTVINVVTIDISPTDQGAISLNTNNTVQGSYTFAGTFSNIRYVGNYLGGPSGVGADPGFFIVFDLTDLTSVTEQSLADLATIGNNSKVAMGGPEARSYIQLGIGADVETWAIKDVIGGVTSLTVQQFVSEVIDKPPFVVASPLLVPNLNSGMLDNNHGPYYLNSANFTGTKWTDLTDAGATTLHKHDHGGMDGLTDVEDHPGFSLVDGTRAFTGVVVGVDPTASDQLATKEYVDSALSFLSDFFYNNDASDIGGIYFAMVDAVTGDAESTFSTAGLGSGDDQALVNWATIATVPGVTTLKAGVYDGHLHAEKTGGTRSLNVYFAVYTRTSGGSETLRATSEISGPVTSKAAITLHANITSDIDIDATDRIVIKWFANIGASGSDVTVALYTEGTTNSHSTVPFDSEVLSDVFVRQDGTKDFTGVVIGVAPTLDLHLATKKYVDDSPIATVDLVSNVAQDRVLGRITAGSGDSEELTAAQVRTLINVEDGAAVDQSAADIRTLGFFDTTNDGGGSGLDADKVDAIEGAELIQRDGSVPYTGRPDFGGQLADNAPFLRGFIDGFITENDTDTAHDIKVNPGACADSLVSNDRMIALTSAIVKRIDAAWAEGTGNGGMATGTVAADTEYNLIIIDKDADGTIDMIFDVSATGANVPANWTARRRIGSVFTDGSSNVLPYVQEGDWFEYDNRIIDLSDAAGTPGVFETATLSVPANSIARFVASARTTTATSTGLQLRRPGTAMNISAVFYRDDVDSTTRQFLVVIEWLVDGSSQVEYTLSSGTWDQASILTIGWIDPRGRNA